MIALVLLGLIAFFATRFMIKDHRNHQRAMAAAAMSKHPSAQIPVDESIEPAYRFPGVPEGWSLDRYAADGIQQMQIHLAQVARRKQNG